VSIVAIRLAYHWLRVVVTMIIIASNLAYHWLRVVITMVIASNISLVESSDYYG